VTKSSSNQPVCKLQKLTFDGKVKSTGTKIEFCGFFSFFSPENLVLGFEYLMQGEEDSLTFIYARHIKPLTLACLVDSQCSEF